MQPGAARRDDSKRDFERALPAARAGLHLKKARAPVFSGARAFGSASLPILDQAGEGGQEPAGADERQYDSPSGAAAKDKEKK